MNMRREVSMNLRKKFRLFTNFEVRTFGTENQKETTINEKVKENQKREVDSMV